MGVRRSGVGERTRVWRGECDGQTRVWEYGLMGMSGGSD